MYIYIEVVRFITCWKSSVMSNVWLSTFLVFIMRTIAASTWMIINRRAKTEFSTWAKEGSLRTSKTHNSSFALPDIDDLGILFLWCLYSPRLFPSSELHSPAYRVQHYCDWPFFFTSHWEIFKNGMQICEILWFSRWEKNVSYLYTIQWSSKLIIKGKGIFIFDISAFRILQEQFYYSQKYFADSSENITSTYL